MENLKKEKELATEKMSSDVKRRLFMVIYIFWIIYDNIRIKFDTSAFASGSSLKGG